MSHFLFHQSLKILKEHNIKNQKILLAVSGGIDSVCLLDVFHNLSSIQNLNLVAVYVHHGERSSSPNLNDYRDKASEIISEYCEKNQIPFIKSEKPTQELKSEQDFRNFRYQQLRKIKEKEEADLIALAHNSDDVLESRLLFMIRGCGPNSLNSMKILKEDLLRPFLHIKREEIKDYAKEKKLKWVEDPSNLDNKFLRNWLRNFWLPELEKRQPGARFRLAESLNVFASTSKIHKEEKSSEITKAITEKGIKREVLRQMPVSEQQQTLAIYMRQKNIKDYGQSHIKEILKHLDREEKNINLKMLKKNWKIDNQFLICE